jgi:gluconokinase
MNSNKIVSNPESPTNLIIVMGVSGSGKSTLAKALAEIYGYVYLDADDFHSDEARAQMAMKIPLTDEQRAPWIALLKQRLQENAKTHTHSVLAFSGLKQKHRDALRSAGLRTLFLFLNSQKATIQMRLRHRNNHFMAPELLDSQFDSLEIPEHEPDVYYVDADLGVEQVVIEAKNIVGSVLPSENSTI